jgi:hypothetical protein
MYYVCVDSSFVPPKDSKYKIYALSMPRFTEFVQPYFERSRRKRTERYMLRGIVEAIANIAYNNELYRPNPPYGDYEGIEFQTVADLEGIVYRIIEKYAKNCITYFLTQEVKKIPPSVQIVYFYGTYPESDPLLSRGMTHLSGDPARRFMFAIPDDQTDDVEHEVPSKMPVERLPSPEYVADEAVKKKNKKKGEFKDGTVYNESMLERVDAKS